MNRDTLYSAAVSVSSPTISLYNAKGYFEPKTATLTRSTT